MRKNVYAHRPETLELTQEMVDLAEDVFLREGSPVAVARALYHRWRRIDHFRYFLVPREKGGYRFNRPDLGLEGIELLDATMRAKGAIMKDPEGGDHFVSSHPLVRKLGESANFHIPERFLSA